ncbi:unnamed protein product [Soboliphyme baturini]|uniref:Stress-induced-phosphoprotein 1 n=1 Tax=Soboliphyme baturini TaxID=241478 RepID=A0A183ILV2_9BILA|nr:unnamed protein product [Soboliphyme baturini]
MADKTSELKQKGNQALAESRFSDAIEFYSQAIALDPQNHVLYSNRSAAYAKAKRYEEALKDAEETIRLDKKWSKGYSRKVAALSFMNRHEEAVQCCEEGLKYNPDNEQLKESLRNEKAAVSSSGSEGGFPNLFDDPNMITKLAMNPKTRELLKDEEFVQKLRQMSTNPELADFKDPRLLQVMSVLLGIDMDNMQRHQPSGQRESETDGNSQSHDKTDEPMDVDQESDEKKKAMQQKQLGNEAYKKKDFATAHQHYEKAIELDPTNITFYSNNAAVFFEEGKFEECIKSCDKAVEVGRENRSDYKLIGKAYARAANASLKLDNYDKAIYYFDKSLSEHRDPNVVRRRHEIERLKKEHDKKAYINPELSLQEKEKGNQCYSEGNYPDAIKHYKEAILRNPDDARLYCNRAACYTKLMEYHLALSDCDEAIKRDPKYVKAYIRRGAALMAMKEPSRALKAYEEALKLEPGSQEALNGVNEATASCSSNPEEMRKKALEDPEIQAILADPAMRLILEQMTQDPKAVKEHLQNPDIASKIEKLIDSGIIGIR